MKKTFTAYPYFQQYSYEVESWARLLAFYQDELEHDKNRLLAVIENNGCDNESFLFGKFQELFRAQERMINFLWGNVKQQARLLDEEFYIDSETAAKMERTQQQLRCEFQDAEELFVRSKNQFLQSLDELYRPPTQ